MDAFVAEMRAPGQINYLGKLLLVHPLKRLYKSLRQKGMLETLKSSARILVDYGFDLKYGTDTMRKVDTDSFDTNSDRKVHAQCYQASKARPLLKMFRILRLSKNKIFVDLGCGKGRVLLIAAQLGLKRVVGIEFCAQLCRQARKNIDSFLKKYPSSPPIEVIEADVASYEFKGDENIFFLYNPFDSVILGLALENISRSVQRTPRDLWLIYNNPVYHELVLSNGLFAQYRRYDIDGEVFHVYQHRALK